MKLDARIYVAGHTGLVGSALHRALSVQGHTDLLTRTRNELDLLNTAAVFRFFEETRPEFVFLAAAKVGGILANATCPADFLRDNLLIQNNVMEASRAAGVNRLLFLGSSSVYPRDAVQPISETALLTGPLEATNRPYALAKIAGIEMCWSYNRQYGTQYLAAMPSNLYGLGDRFNPQNSHVLPALVRKTAEAIETAAKAIEIWGSGTPRREFLYADDLAAACLFLMNLPNESYQSLLAQDQPPLINIGTGEDVTIRELAETIADIMGFKGELLFDASKPDGTPRKVMDVRRIHALGWRPTVTLRDGIQRVVREFNDSRMTREC